MIEAINKRNLTTEGSQNREPSMTDIARILK